MSPHKKKINYLP